MHCPTQLLVSMRVAPSSRAAEHCACTCAAQEGTRVCVGQRLAVNEAKITLAHVFRRWRIPKKGTSVLFP
jgi:cytochrome P450